MVGERDDMVWEWFGLFFEEGTVEWLLCGRWHGVLPEAVTYEAVSCVAPENARHICKCWLRMSFEA